MSQDPADSENKIIEDFFENLKVENQYYSKQLRQPVLLIGEKNLYKSVKEAIEKNNQN